MYGIWQHVTFFKRRQVLQDLEQTRTRWETAGPCTAEREVGLAVEQQQQRRERELQRERRHQQRRRRQEQEEAAGAGAAPFVSALVDPALWTASR